jgi:hypothetical protein
MGRFNASWPGYQVRRPQIAASRLWTGNWILSSLPQGGQTPCCQGTFSALSAWAFLPPTHCIASQQQEAGQRAVHACAGGPLVAGRQIPTVHARRRVVSTVIGRHLPTGTWQVSVGLLSHTHTVPQAPQRVSAAVVQFLSSGSLG